MSNKKAALIIGVTALCGMTFYSIFTFAIDLIQPDSGGYLRFSASRTPGYPLFLMLVRAIGLELTVIPYIQLFIFSCATFLLGFSFFKATDNIFWGIATIVGVMANIELVKYNFAIITDSFASSFIMVILALAILIISARDTIDKRLLALLSAVLGLAIITKPTSYALLGILPFIIVIAWKDYKKSIIKNSLLVTLPLIAMIIAGSSVQKIKNGFFGTQTFLGSNMIGKVSLIVDGNMKVDKHQEVVTFMANRSLRARNLIDLAPDLQTRSMLSSVYYQELRAKHILPMIDIYAEKIGSTQNAVSKEAAFEIMKLKPKEYLQDVLMNLYSLWFFSELLTKREAVLTNVFIEGRKPLPLFEEYPEDVRGRNAIIVYAYRIFAGFALVFSVLSLLIFSLCFLARKKVNERLMPIVISSVAVHSWFLLTASLQAGIPRYALVMFPALVIINCGALDMIFSKIQRLKS